MQVLPFCGEEHEHRVVGAKPNEFIQRICKRSPSLPFTQSGHVTELGRWYAEKNCFLESATHECRSPDDLIHQVAQIEECIRGVATDLSVQTGRNIQVFKAGLDYSRHRRCGVHLNHSWTQPLSTDRKQALLSKFGHALPILLVATLPIFGGGGLDVRHDGFQWVNSSRACSTVAERGRTTGCGRHAMLDLFDRDARRHPIRRIQLLTGDGLRSYRQQHLRAGVQMAFLAACDLGHRLPCARLANSLRDWHAVNQSGFQTIVTLLGGHTLTAGDLAEICLEFVRDHLGDLPLWVEGIVSEWEAADSASRNTSIVPSPDCFPLDGKVLQQLLRAHLMAEGLQWDDTPRFDVAIRRVSTHVKAIARPEHRNVRLSPSSLRTLRSRHLSTLRATLRDSALDLHELEEVLRIREGCFWLLSLYAQIYPGEFFRKVDHELEGRLSESPPPLDGSRADGVPRAELRRQIIRDHTGQSGWRVGWDNIATPTGTMDLSPETDRLSEQSRWLPDERLADSTSVHQPLAPSGRGC